MDAREFDFSDECPDKLEPAIVWKYCDAGHEHICFTSESCPLCAANKQILDLLAESLAKCLNDRTPCSDGHSVIWYNSEECPLCVADELTYCKQGHPRVGYTVASCPVCDCLRLMKTPRMWCGDGT